LIFGIALMLIWAAIIEAFFSQYNEPVIPYVVKIGFGVLEIGILILFLWKSGKKSEVQASGFTSKITLNSEPGTAHLKR
jgi:hypothetical protein